MFYKKKGFTLLELMIVVIIIGILATLALPRFMGAAAQARWAAATSTLGIIRSAQFRYYAEYTMWATDVDATDGTTVLDIQIEDTAEWNIIDPAGTDAEVAEVTHIPTSENYTMAADGTVTGP